MLMTAIQRPAQVPPLLKLENIPWVVFVVRQEAPVALDEISDRSKIEDLEDRFEAGEITEEEFHEAIGPSPGYRPVDVYGPYSERQAEALAAYLQQPEVAAEHGITIAVPGRLTRFIA